MTVHAVLTGTGSVSLTGTGAMSAHAALTGTGSGGSSTLAITSQGTNHSTTSTLSVTHFTPASGTLVIVSFLDFLNSSNTVSIADSFGDSGGGAWTAFTGSLLTSSGTFSEAYGGWYRLIGTGAGSSAPTITAASFTGGNQQMCVDLITPSGGSITVPQSKVVTASFSTTGSVALTSGPASTSLVWGTAGCTATALTPTVTTAGFTALDLTNASLSVATAYKNTSGPQTTAWSGLSGGQVNFLGSVEIAI